MSAGLPGNVFASSVVYKRVAGGNPAAGSECSDTVPAGKFWDVISYLVDLVQGITQTPQPILQIDDGSNVLWESLGSSAVQVASSTCRYVWAEDVILTGQIGATPNTRSWGTMTDDLYLYPGFRIRTVTLGIGANTDYGAPSIYVAEYSLE